MPKTSRTRIDYRPGPAALAALQAAQKLQPDHNIQRLIDRLLVVAASALAHGYWAPPRLHGRDRDAWTLPEELRRLVPDGDG